MLVDFRVTEKPDLKRVELFAQAFGCISAHRSSSSGTSAISAGVSTRGTLP